MKQLMTSLGFVEEIGEYMLDVGIQTKMKKIKKWISKGTKKVKELQANEQDEDELADNILNDKVNIDEIW